ncbi:hypothetical protein AKJ37_06895 [candidate division MSBL1 archaeon SCGC-AAA259I09]|uniref:Uncharacterized protein n=2 Tax=candidate division MSBL1 TaxID=215777 RepID=A0A133UMD4_9EURY|nr:hypothetical protein AKJ62_00685 [candidate division MSBL1 archaeon SCGC-AAA259D14]KXA95351.1 hypothetical protein AKJ37_06895 [candidate division MSBL1 archaeon SCGC-AAA259I09]
MTFHLSERRESNRISNYSRHQYELPFFRYKEREILPTEEILRRSVEILFEKVEMRLNIYHLMSSVKLFPSIDQNI